MPKEAPVFRQIVNLAVIAVPVFFAPSLAAQEVREIEPAWRVVEREATPARSGPDSVYYTVMELQAGRVVRVDGETEVFSRVRYPAGATLLVPVDEVRVIGQTSDGSTRVELVKASGLRAPSELMGMSGSWMTVYDPALPEGTALRVTEAVKNDAGDVVGYRVSPVVPPASEGFARMYIASAALRAATPEEVARHLGGGSEPTPAGTEPGEKQPVVEEPAVKEPAADVPVVKQENPGRASEPATNDEEINEEINGEINGEIDGESGGVDAEAAPVEVSQGRQPAAPGNRANDGALLPAGLEALEASFEAARKQPAEEVDQALEELLAEFQRTRDATDDDDRLAWQLDQRVEWLKLRIATRDQRRSIRAALAEADERAIALEAQAQEWQRGRSYQLVGLLTQSSVYNGERLPRMYRVQAINSIDGSPQTLGYLTPGDGVDSKVGSVVGIVGQARFDPQLRLMVIRPDRIDVMPR